MIRGSRVGARCSGGSDAVDVVDMRPKEGIDTLRGGSLR